MFRILVVTGAAEYRAACLLWLLQLEHYRRVDHPVFHLIQQCPSLLNEERCEISLSHLARLHACTAIKQDPRLLSLHYRLLNSTIRMRNALMPEYRSSKSGTYIVKPDSKEVQVTSHFMQGVLRQLIAGQYQYYTGLPDAWTSSSAAQKGFSSEEAPAYLPDQPIALFDSCLQRTRKHLGGPFCVEFLHLLPEGDALTQKYRGTTDGKSTAVMSLEGEDDDPQRNVADADFMEPEIFSFGEEKIDDVELHGMEEVRSICSLLLCDIFWSNQYQKH